MVWRSPLKMEKDAELLKQLPTDDLKKMLQDGVSPIELVRAEFMRRLIAPGRMLFNEEECT